MVFLLPNAPNNKAKVRAVRNEVDKCLFREIFNECLKNVPKGPQSTKYNDWDEVVALCHDVSVNQSFRNSDNIKPECK